MSDFRQEFIEFAIRRNALCFGEFKTKAGRMSPYFFNAGLFNDGDSLRQFGQFYAKAIRTAQLPFDMLFGPAYKGIPLVSAIAIALAESGANRPFCFNRKEAKDHGEGGNIVGAPLAGQVLIVDDVISAPQTLYLVGSSSPLTGWSGVVENCRQCRKSGRPTGFQFSASSIWTTS